MSDIDKREEREHAHRKFREMRLEVIPPDPTKQRAEGEPEDTRIPVAISSEEPVERYDWWDNETYLEVLGHGPGEVNLDYARDGLPFCLDHDVRKQIGLLEDVTLDSDRRIRGMLRAGNHPDAEWAIKDIQAGIRKKVSVGYDPGESFEQSEEGGKKVRRYKGWMPLEASSVPVPADYGVGIGRSARPGALPSVTPPPAAATSAQERTMTDEERAAAAAAAAEAAAGQTAIARNTEIGRLGKLSKQFPEAAGMLLGWIERGVSHDQALDEIAEARKGRAAEPTPAGFLDLSEKERRNFNLAGALVARAEAQEGNRSALDAKSIGIVLEAHSTIKERLEKEKHGRELRGGLLLPMDFRIDMDAAGRGAALARASVTGNVVGTSSLGGAGVQTSIVGFVDLLRARTRTIGLGLQTMFGLTDTIAFVRQLTANSFTWTGENPSSEMSLTAATVEVFTMSPKVGMAGSSYSRRMLAQGNANFDINSFLMNDLNKIAAIGIDSAVVNGGGGTAPTGIRGTTGVNNKTLGANGAALTWDDIVDMERLVEDANADIGTINWLTNPSTKAKLKRTRKDTTAGSAYLWESGPNFHGQIANTLNGYGAQTSTSIPKNLTKGTNTTVCSAAVYGVWDQGILGEWGGAAELIVNPYTYLKQNVIEVVLCLGVDVGVLNPAAFAKCEEILTT